MDSDPSVASLLQDDKPLNMTYAIGSLDPTHQTL